MCTNFFIEAEDGSIVTGRSMEFGSDVASRLELVPRDSTGAVNLAFHLLNTVDLPYGVDMYPGRRGLDGGPQHTPWVTVVDHAQRHYYYRTYDHPDECSG